MPRNRSDPGEKFGCFGSKRPRIAYHRAGPDEPFPRASENVYGPMSRSILRTCVIATLAIVGCTDLSQPPAHIETPVLPLTPVSTHDASGKRRPIGRDGGKSRRLPAIDIPMDPAARTALWGPQPAHLTNNQLSRALGFQNLGNTCFANAATKFLWIAMRQKINDLAYEQELEASALVAVEGMDASVDGMDASVDLMVHAKAMVQPAFLALVSSLDEHDWTGAPSPDQYTGLLNEWFDEMRAYLSILNEGPCHVCLAPGSGYPLHIGVDQIDSAEFLVKALALLDYDAHFPSIPFMNVSEFADIKKAKITKVWVPGAREAERIVSLPATAIRTRYVGSVVARETIVALPVSSETKTIADAWKIYMMAEELKIPLRDRIQQPGKIEINRTVVPVAVDPIPRQAIFSLKRYALGRKVNLPVIASPHLDIDLFSPATNGPGPLVPAKTLSMSLRAVIVHHGAAAYAGHYVVYVFDQERNGWFLHNDSQVLAVTEAEVQKAVLNDGYIFLYRE